MNYAFTASAGISIKVQHTDLKSRWLVGVVAPPLDLCLISNIWLGVLAPKYTEAPPVMDAVVQAPIVNLLQHPDCGYPRRGLRCQRRCLTRWEGNTQRKTVFSSRDAVSLQIKLFPLFPSVNKLRTLPKTESSWRWKKSSEKKSQKTKPLLLE